MGNACTTDAEVPNESDIEERVHTKLASEHRKTLQREQTKTFEAKKEAEQLKNTLHDVQKRLADALGANYDEDEGVYRSQIADKDIDSVAGDMSVTDFVFENLKEFQDRVAVVDPSSGRSYTYAKLERLVKRVAAGLYARGFRKGDVFAIMAPNVREFPIIFHAVASLGGIITTLNNNYKHDAVVHQLQDTHAKFMAVTTKTLPAALSAIEECKEVQELFIFGSDSFSKPKDLKVKVTPFREVKGDKAPTVKIHPKKDVLVIPYSSGTSGLPKGVMLTHHNIIANIIQSETAVGIERDDVVLGLLPMFHMYGMFIFLALALRQGATLITMKKKFDLKELLEAMQEYKVSVAHLVPPIILAFSKAPVIDKYDLSSLREIFSGAAPLSNEMAAATSKRLGVSVRQGYGMTELSPVATVASSDTKKYGSVGRLLPNTLAKVVDTSSGEPVGPNERGELWIKGPQQMKGYLNDEASTSATVDSDGFLHTGDVAYCDDQGDFWVVDRVKELIKYKGFQVAPAELEGVLTENPKIADAGVIGVADDDAGEIPVAFVQKAKGSEDMTESDVKKYVAEKVAGYKKVREVHFVDAIPKSLSGKILRRELAELARKRRAEAAGAGKEEAKEAVEPTKSAEEEEDSAKVTEAALSSLDDEPEAAPAAPADEEQKSSADPKPEGDDEEEEEPKKEAAGEEEAGEEEVGEENAEEAAEEEPKKEAADAPEEEAAEKPKADGPEAQGEES